MSFATGTTRIFRFGLLTIAMLSLSIVLALGNGSLARAQSDDAAGDAAQAVQPDQNGASDADSNDPNAASAQQTQNAAAASDPAQQAQSAADAAAEALDTATEARDQLESDGASQDQIDAANRAVAEARFNKDNADAAVKSADDAANQ